MNIKHLAIALLTTALISTPLFAHTDGDEHTSNIKKMDKATPSSVSTQTTVDADKSKEKGHGMATGKRTHEPLVIKQGIDKASPVAGNETDDNASQSSKASSFGSKISTEGQTHRGSADTSDNDSDSHSSKAFIKIGDIKGESQDRAADTVSPDRIEFKSAIAAPDTASDSDSDNDADDNDATATDYNSSRSNKSEDYGVAAPDPDDDADGNIEKSTGGHNTSRSNKTTGGLSNVDVIDTDSENSCENLKENERCVDGHVTVLK